MKTKKIFALILTLSLLLSSFALLTVNADSTSSSDYSELWRQKDVATDDFFGVSGPQLKVLCWSEKDIEGILLTKKASSLTYLVEDASSESLKGFPIYQSGNKVLTCVEFAKIYKSTVVEKNGVFLGKTSFYRKLVQELGITEKELKDIYAEPSKYIDTAMEIFSDIDDNVKNGLKRELQSYWKPENFVIEAAFLKDAHEAEALLAFPGSVYIKELGYTISALSIFQDFHHTPETLSKYDLTTEGFSSFFAYMRLDGINGVDRNIRDAKGRTPLEMLYDIEYYSDKQRNNEIGGSFKELWAEKIRKEGVYSSTGLRYIASYYSSSFHCELGGEGGSVWGMGYDFILYTEQGQKLTYNYYTNDTSNRKGAMFSSNWEYFGGKIYLCEELEEWFKEIDIDDEETGLYTHKSRYRLIVQKLGLTADELREAYRKMMEEPEYARDILSELSDKEFKNYALHLKDCGVPANYIIEGACMKDDAKGEALLASPGVAYCKELGYSIDARAIFQYSYTPVEELFKYDLTTTSISTWMEDLNAYFEHYGDKGNLGNFGVNDSQGRTPRERFNVLYAEYERQMSQKPQTGEALYLIPVALVSLTLGALVIYPRRRKIDNI